MARIALCSGLWARAAALAVCLRPGPREGQTTARRLGVCVAGRGETSYNSILVTYKLRCVLVQVIVATGAMCRRVANLHKDSQGTLSETNCECVLLVR